jgi:tripartite-type tricarboxylate transporter receptor subunit TctC
VINPALPVSTVKDLIAHVKSKPGQLSYSSAGTGTPTHLAGELLKTMAGIDITHVPYKGGPPAAAAVVANEVLLYFAGTAPALPFVKSGRLKALAVTGKARSSLFPETPTVIESGIADFDVDQWYGILVPARTPRPVIARLQAEFSKAMQVPEIRERLIGLGVEPVGSTPEQFDAYMRSEITKWEKVVKASGARAD